MVANNSEIYFNDLKRLKSIIDELYTEQKGEALSAHKCLLINQIEEDITVLQSYSPNYFSYKRYYYHNEGSKGSEGLVFLPDHAMLKSIISAFETAKYKSLSFRSDRGFLAISADEEYVEEEGLISSNIDTCHQYGGLTSDFDPPEFLEDNLLGSVTEENFQKLLIPLREFGGVEENSKEPFLLQILSSRLLVMTHSGMNKSGFLLCSKDGSFSEDSEPFFIERRFIPRISKIALNSQESRVDIYYDEGWVQFVGRKGVLLIKTTTPLNQFNQVQNLIVTQSSKEFISKRSFSIPDLIRPLDYNECRQVIKSLVCESDGVTRLLIPDQQSERHIRSVTFDIPSADGDFQPILIVNSLVKSLLTALKKVADQVIDNPQVEISQRKDEGNSRILYLYFRIKDSRFDNEIAGIMTAGIAEENLDQLEADD